MHKYLLDTHTLLWMQDDSKLLSVHAKRILGDLDSKLHISVASFWEIVIKSSLGKIEIKYTIDDLHMACLANDIVMLPIEIATLNHLKSLPGINKDPFDRIIVATAIDLGLQVITLDPNIRKYDLVSVW
jgi:PIN domain nuclease of toxin-antitoxin system